MNLGQANQRYSGNSACGRGRQAYGNIEAASAVAHYTVGGVLSSVQAGINGIFAGGSTPPAFLVCPCDLPKLEPADISGVLNKAAHGDSRAIIAPVCQGKRGHPTAFGITLAKEILQLDSMAFGLNEIVKRHALHVVEIPAQSDAVLRDADTPEEWRQRTME